MACRVKGTTAFWFNSYGVNAWVSSRQSTTSDHDLQSVASKVCGLYACYFVAHGLPQLNPTRRPWNFLTQDVNHNDAIIKKKVVV